MNLKRAINAKGWLAIPLFIVSLNLLNSGAAATTSATASLPSQIHAVLNTRFPGWRILPAARQCHEPHNETASVVRGDFNGDGRPDFGVRLIQRNRAAIVVLVSSRVGWNTIVNGGGGVDGDPYLIASSQLGIQRRGSRVPTLGDGGGSGPTVHLRNDALIGGECEVSSTIEIYENGRFRTLVTSD